MAFEPENEFAARVCLPRLRDAQNSDGGWGFRAASVSRTEPTCWALLAAMADPEQGSGPLLARGSEFLRSTQLANGAWPASPCEHTGSWVTSLACWVLGRTKIAPQSLSTGLKWLCADWPSDSTWWRRTAARFSSQRQLAPVNSAYRGWGWTPGTSSWVEPTAMALLALEQAPECAPETADKRRQLGEKLLLDRMCPGGGWNSGNPVVYGVVGEPQVSSTVWAVLALRRRAEHPGVQQGLAWLQNNTTKIGSVLSLALARICLKAYERRWPAEARDVWEPKQDGRFPEDLVSIAVASLAASEVGDWLVPEHGGST